MLSPSRQHNFNDADFSIHWILYLPNFDSLNEDRSPQSRIKSLKMSQWDLVLGSQCLELYIVRITLNHLEVPVPWFCVYQESVCIEGPHRTKARANDYGSDSALGERPLLKEL